MYCCEKEFNKKAIELYNISEILNDTWKLCEKDEKIYLSKKKNISVKSERLAIHCISNIDDPAATFESTCDNVFSIEYHVLFHPSYQVPVLYFNAYSDNGLISLDDIPKIFVKEFETEKSNREIKNIITQTEHPILFKPFFMVHPCKVNEILGDFLQSKNFILTFLTLFGPSIQLETNPEYDKFYASQ